MLQVVFVQVVAEHKGEPVRSVGTKACQAKCCGVVATGRCVEGSAATRYGNKVNHQAVKGVAGLTQPKTNRKRCGVSVIRKSPAMSPVKRTGKCKGV